MIAFSYVDRFAELAELPHLKKLEVLEQAHGRASGLWFRNLANFIVCLIPGFAVGLAPRMFFQIPVFVEGLLLAVGMLAAILLSQKLYAQPRSEYKPASLKNSNDSAC